MEVDSPCNVMHIYSGVNARKDSSVHKQNTEKQMHSIPASGPKSEPLLHTNAPPSASLQFYLLLLLRETLHPLLN